MPRKVMPRKSGQDKSSRKTSPQKAIFKDIQQHLGEETESSSSFNSVSTDINATDYGLEFTDKTLLSHRERMPHVNAGPSTSGNVPRRETTERFTRRSLTKKTLAPKTMSQLEASTSRRSRTDSSSRRMSHKGPSRRKQQVPKKRKGYNVLKDIKRFQNSTRLLIPRLPFSRVIREIIMDNSLDVFRITPTALEALQESSELYLSQLFSDAYRCTLHRDRLTLMIKDMELARYLRGRSDPGNL